MSTPDKPKAPLTFEFDSPEAREHFATWLCESGEQDYWEWMRVRETESSGPITVLRFHYHGPEDETKAENDPSRYGEFLCDNTIRTTCGRLTQDFEDEDEDEDTTDD